MEFLFIVALIVAIIFWVKKSAAEKEIANRDKTNRQQSQKIAELEQRLAELAKYQGILDADVERSRYRGETPLSNPIQ